LKRAVRPFSYGKSMTDSGRLYRVYVI